MPLKLSVSISLTWVYCMLVVICSLLVSEIALRHQKNMSLIELFKEVTHMMLPLKMIQNHNKAYISHGIYQPNRKEISLSLLRLYLRRYIVIILNYPLWIWNYTENKNLNKKQHRLYIIMQFQKKRVPELYKEKEIAWIGEFFQLHFRKK